MIGRENGRGIEGNLWSEPGPKRQRNLRRAKSMSSTVTRPFSRPTTTRSDVLTQQERQEQARAAAAKAFKNDLLRRGEPGVAHDGTPLRRQSVRFEPTPPGDPEYNRSRFFQDVYER